ncbi:hypothetical protein SAICODRAFT_31890 [Saitoella complicata NRRL Y-17804]|uniref:uncharacterized protein n=1 Tax=Saitoella complicata (strain BCRC 22490 / CBS 7301 / JCM 7358 / NBRC 10748 / NRRL Y-17804) TaxID=698492 RepID=UPI000867FBBD|nr:uncharacterized protein SAICODRAFT_31890 [Saitoella complicata NRRL Y-17804]ODQ50623.1 hypothetical protein SAICODRAFT_31890 [Saitoella complicata NRRL Y-17804]
MPSHGIDSSASATTASAPITPRYTPSQRSNPFQLDSNLLTTAGAAGTSTPAFPGHHHLPPPIAQVPLSPGRIQPSLIPTLPPYSSIHHRGAPMASPHLGGRGGGALQRVVPDVLQSPTSPGFDPGYGHGGLSWQAAGSGMYPGTYPFQNQNPYAPAPYPTTSQGYGPQGMNMGMGMGMGMGNPAWTGQVQWAPPAPSSHGMGQNQHSQSPVPSQSQAFANLNVNLNLTPTMSVAGQSSPGEGVSVQGTESMGSKTSGGTTMSSTSATMMQSAGSAETIRPSATARREDRGRGSGSGWRPGHGHGRGGSM